MNGRPLLSKTDDLASPANTVELDGISLSQALRDFEIANARVIDLTQRLIASEQARLTAVDQAEQLRIRVATAETELAQLRSSKAYRLAHQVGVLRARLSR